jgi:hypothetical protein
MSKEKDNYFIPQRHLKYRKHQKKEKNSPKAEEKRRKNSNDFTITTRSHEGATTIPCSRETEGKEVFILSSVCGQTGKRSFIRKDHVLKKEDFSEMAVSVF